MLCCICKEKEAKVHLTQIVGDKMQKVDLCDDCAKQKGVDDPTGYSLANLLVGLGANLEPESTERVGELKCVHCGFTQADFKKTGRLGCPECYHVFGDALESLLKSMHKGTNHVGKTPAARRQVRDLERRVKSLQDQLGKAVAAEDYELAAKIRDEIKRAQVKPGETTRA